MGLNPSLGCSPSGREAYPTRPYSPLLRRLQIGSLTRKPAISRRYSLISISTPQSASAGASLRASSEGACYHQIRMAFYFYSHVTQAVGLTMVRPSIPRKGNFSLHRSSSSGFRSDVCDSGAIHTQPLIPQRNCGLSLSLRLLPIRN